jgi:hypothetical protein
MLSPIVQFSGRAHQLCMALLSTGSIKRREMGSERGEKVGMSLTLKILQASCQEYPQFNEDALRTVSRIVICCVW